MERLKTKKTQPTTILFLFSFIIGALCIYFTLMELVFPLIIVFFYSVVLYFIDRSKYLSLSGFEKNTPYYLGFLFTLFSLFSLSIQSDFSFDSTASLLTTMSIALSTTILGLIMRQILLSMSISPSEDYLVLLKQIQDHTQNLQEAFVPVKSHVTNALNEFETIKKAVLERENKTVSQAAEKLRKDIFAGLEGTFSEKIKGVLDSVSDFYIEDHDTTIGQILPDSYKVEISERLDNFYREVMDSLNKNTGIFLDSLSQLSLQLKKSFRDEESKEQLNLVKKLIDSYEVELNGLSKSLEEKLSNPDK